MNRRNFLGLLSCAPLAAISGMWQKPTPDSKTTNLNLRTEAAVPTHPFDIAALLTAKAKGETDVEIEVWPNRDFVRVCGKMYKQSSQAPIRTCGGKEIERLCNAGSTQPRSEREC